MKVLLKFTALFLLSCSSFASEYICLSNKTESLDALCYKTAPEKDSTARSYFLKLAENIKNPVGLVAAQGEMAEFVKPSALVTRISKYYSHITENSIHEIISLNNKSAIFLTTGETLFFDHNINTFVFDYQTPLELSGASWLFSKGYSFETVQYPNIESNCRLSKQGIIYTTESKGSVIYSEKTSFCLYHGFYFHDESSVRHISQVNQGSSSLNGSQVEFARFLKWLKS